MSAHQLPPSDVFRSGHVCVFAEKKREKQINDRYTYFEIGMLRNVEVPFL